MFYFSPRYKLFFTPARAGDCLWYGQSRPSGNGMVRRRNGGRWEDRIVAGRRENGDSIFRYIYADNQKELTAKFRQNLNAYHGIDLTEQSKVTLAAWLDQMAVTLRSGTPEHYHRDTEDHVKPHLDSKSLAQLTAAGLRKHYDALKQNDKWKPRPGQGCGLSRAAVRGIHPIQKLPCNKQESAIPGGLETQ